MCSNYLLQYHKDTILEILSSPDCNKHYSLELNFLELFENEPKLGNELLHDAKQSLFDWNNAIQSIQQELKTQYETSKEYNVKRNVHCRIWSLPLCSDLHRNLVPKYQDINKLLQFSGTVVRIGSAKILEYKRDYYCTKCKAPTISIADFERQNDIKPPKFCKNCFHNHFSTSSDLKSENCRDYQEIRVQEVITQPMARLVPSSIWVVLEDDLVNSCKPGDSIVVCGIVKQRWSALYNGRKIVTSLAICANHIKVCNIETKTQFHTIHETNRLFKQFWLDHENSPLIGRNKILQAFCSDIYHLYYVKLAICIILAGGNTISDNSETRSESHLLLIGDPGTGKSQLLRFAAKIMPRSVFTTGIGSTNAGLTAAAIKEDGEWQLEGGALVLADGGICCIDEFNSMKAQDKTSILEPMEQQTISVAKANIVCKLSTRCSILAASNPKFRTNNDSIELSTAIPSPLLSRFDLVLILNDKIDPEWDSELASFVLDLPDCSQERKRENNYSFSSCSSGTVQWTNEMLQLYFVTIRKYQPKLTLDAKRILSGYYQVQRRNSTLGSTKGRSTVRLLDSLVRLSQGHAKLMCHKENVEIVDAIFAIVLMELSIGQNGGLFNLKSNIHQTYPDDSMEDYLQMATEILTKLILPDLLEIVLTKSVAPTNTTLINTFEDEIKLETVISEVCANNSNVLRKEQVFSFEDDEPLNCCLDSD